MSEGDSESECVIEDKWLVVHFVEEQSVEIIPKKWYITSINKSYWPETENGVKVMECIKKCISPRSNWSTYTVNVLGEYDDFNRASEKVVKAKTTDILSSDNNIPKKRKRTKKRLSYSSCASCSSDNGDYPIPPKRSLKKAGKETKHNNSLSNSHSLPNTKNECTVNNDTSIHNKENIPSSSTAYQNSDELYNNKQLEFHKKILKLMHTMDYKINNIQADLNILLKSINTNASITVQSIQKDNILLNIIKSMPFTSKEQLDLTEDLSDLQLDTLAQELSLIGGDTVKETTKTLMYRMFSNGLGSSYTWEGLKMKNAFKTLKIAQVIIRAIRLNPKTSNASELDVIKHIKSWLLRAKERHINGEKKRQEMK